MSPDPRTNPTSPRATSPRAARPSRPAWTPSPAVRVLLSPLSGLYALAARGRARYWRGRRRRLPKPVVSVGNLTFGGTGKTPFVIHACRELRRRGRRVAVLSRGYRSSGGQGNDEALVIRRHVPEVRIVENPDRHAAGLPLASDVDVFLLDDGFQHHPLHRDHDVVLVDATAPFGGGWCPPGGRLREPLAALDRATLVVLTRADLVDRDSLGETMRRVRARTAAPIVTAMFRPEPAPALAGRDVLVACGIGNPGAFVRTVEGLGARVAETRFFRDHHAYDAADAAALAGAGLPVVVTEKDAVKLEPLWGDGAELHVIRIEFSAEDGAAELAALFDSV